MPHQPDQPHGRFDRSARFRARDGSRDRVCALLRRGPRGAPRGRARCRRAGSGRVLAVGKPAGWLADQLPSLADAATTPRRRQARRRPRRRRPGSFADRSAAGDGAACRRSRRTPSTRARSAQAAGQAAAEDAAGHRRLDVAAARRAASRATSRRKGVKVIRDAAPRHGHLRHFLVDWGKLSAPQAKQDKPDAVVVFIGANEGFPMNVRRARGEVLRRRLGGRVRQPGAPHDGHLPPRRRRARVLAAAADATARAARNKIARVVNAGARRRRRARTARRSACSTWARSSRRATSTATRCRSTARTRSSARPTASTSTARASRVAADDVLAALREDFTGP